MATASDIVSLGDLQARFPDNSTGHITAEDMRDTMEDLYNALVAALWKQATQTPRVVFRSPQQEHEFGYPFQIGHHETADHPATAQIFEVVLEAGDIVVLGTDGLFDNLSDQEILEEAFKHANVPDGGDPRNRRAIEHRASPDLRKLASAICNSLADVAFWKSVDKSIDTPFSLSASEAFNVVYNGGKKDDITIVVAVVAPNVNMSRGRNYNVADL